MENKKILVVDDSVSIRRILISCLEKKDYSVNEAEDGEEAIRMSSSNHYDLIILDLLMPKLDGIQVINILKRKNINIPIFVVSGKLNKNKIVELLNLGIKVIISKPIDADRLYKEMDNIF